MSDLSNGLESELSAAFDTAMAEEATTAVPEEATPQAASAVPETSVHSDPAPISETGAPSAPSPKALADDDLIEVVVNGETKTLPYKEARQGFMMHAAFTQKTQELAAQRREAERLKAEAEQWRTASQQEIQRAKQFEADVKAMLRDKNKLAALYMNAETPEGTASAPPTPTAPAIDPAQLREQLFREIAPNVQQYVSQQLAAQHEMAAHAQDVSSFTTSLIEESPVLKVLGSDYAEQVYAKVLQLAPATPAEAKEYIRLEIDSMKQRLHALTGDAAKASAVAKAKAATGIERGGSPVTPSPKEYSSFKDMHGDIEAWLGTQPAP